MVRYTIKELFSGKTEQYLKLNSKKERFKTQLLSLSQIKMFMKAPSKTIKRTAKEESFSRMDLTMLDNGWIISLME
jgi:hypothetical protein